jgi:hypothetical protein
MDKYGHDVPTKYVKVHTENDPWACGCLSSTGTIYSGPIHVTEKHEQHGDILKDIDYNKDNLHFFLPSYKRTQQVNAALHCIPDCALGIEVQ